MAGITGLGTTFNLPNYVGELFALTPDDTPLLSAIGGLTGGMGTSAVQMEWQTYDLRDPGQRVHTEGETAPTAEERVRGNVRNVCQIHQEKVSVSYTKQSTPGQTATPSSAPFTGVPGANPVANEMTWQIQQALKSIALDVNWSFINGKYQLPTTNSTPRKTRGLLEAITTNRQIHANALAVTGASAATDTITVTTHGFAVDDNLVFTDTSTATNLVAGRVYWVVTVTDANNFKISATKGGAAITIGTVSNLAYTRLRNTTSPVTDVTGDDINGLLQLAYDNGGFSEQFTGTMLVNSIQKRKITKAFASQYGQYTETSRNVGGVNVTTVVTDFGTLNVMMDRHVPQDTIIAVSLEELAPFFLTVPGKGHFFEEPLAKTGASDESQLYGEIGLKYGAEKHHAVLNGLKVV